MASDADQYQPKERVFTRRRQVSDVGPVQVPGATLYDEDGNVADYEHGVAVRSKDLVELRQVLEEVRDLGREIVLHLREMTGDDYSGDI